jgi:hypothetical protein
MAYFIAFKCPQMIHEAFLDLSSASTDVFVTTPLRFAFVLVDPTFQSQEQASKSNIGDS